MKFKYINNFLFLAILMAGFVQNSYAQAKPEATNELSYYIELKQNEQDQNLKRIERTRIEEKIQSKNRELTSAAIHVMSKNEILDSIRQKISKINNKAEIIPLESFREINFIISDSLRMDDDWQVFKRHFIEVHPSFFEKLKIKN